MTDNQQSIVEEEGTSDNQQSILDEEETSGNELPLANLKRWEWWLFVSLNIFFLIVGQAAAVLLGRFYYDQGGSSKWMATIVQTAAFPILFIPFFLIRSPMDTSSSANPPSMLILLLIYFSLGSLMALDNWLYSAGLVYLSASTYSLVCASQLAFNAVFSYFINSQKFTILILNSVIILSSSSALLAVNDDPEHPVGVSKSKYFIGFICSLAASALYALILSLMELSFQKVMKKETFSVVLEMQIYTSLVATIVSVLALFASAEWKSLPNEMASFGKGTVSYVLTLVGTAVAWQTCSVGIVALIFVVSSLFSNAISTVSLAITPLAALIVFHDKMNGVKIIALFLAIWGFFTYLYQSYIDESKVQRRLNDTNEPREERFLC
ncbi:probable purine permease 11 isoform X1 [Cucurbita moschata]|uniref:Probable purine permease n=1 Tax=Cucurbita moschata TaxID=3662 RepID=A0A6J1HN40_CUCMO|nr:probable purine permease 11 isoform X1 [Cucurbita moschata]XP_022964419.1 probable purine permease 11 isoform X1 [Cucurbita moschata]